MAGSILVVFILSFLCVHHLTECKPSASGSDLVAKDTGIDPDLSALAAELDSVEKISKSSDDNLSEEDERQEAIDTGTFQEAADVTDKKAEIKEAIESGTYTADAPSEDSREKERKEAIATGTFNPVSENDIPEKELNEAANDLLKEEEFGEGPAENKITDSSGGKKNKEDSWLPPKTSFTEEIIVINQVDGAKGLVDGDILPPQIIEEEEMDNENENENEKRNARRDRSYLWRNRVVPYFFDVSLSSNARKVILETITEYHQKTCIRFKESYGSDYKIRFMAGGGCYSYVGKQRRRSQNYQDVSIGKNCDHKGIVIHELMHALGFYHEQSRYDRDKYINIDFSNILSGRENNFAKKTEAQVTSLGLPYDFDGVMHYGAYAFAKDRSKPVITKKSNTGGQIGQRKGFSVTDLKQLNLLYDCKTDSSVNSWSSWSNWSPCFDFGTGKKEHSQRFCFKDDLSKCPGANSVGTQSRERPCKSGPAVTTSKPVVTHTVTPTRPSTGNTINEPMCGTRSTSLGHPILDPQHIVGGNNALPGDWPWQVGFASQGSTFVYCGGTLINNEWIVSAAHCFSKSNNPSRITARLGEHNRRLNEGNEEVVTLKKIIIHPLYDRRSLNNDIAMIQLSRKVKYNKFIRPACVPSSGFEVASGTDAFVSGWGTTSEGGSTSPILQVASVPIMSKAECSSKMSGITDQKICAGYAKGGIDSCQGDSGGPLVAKNSKGKFDLIGVVSYGIGCARPNRPGVYAKVSALRAFIDSGPAVTTSKPVVTHTVTPTRPSTGNTINEPMCGTRSTSLGHPILDPQHIVGGNNALPGDWPWQVGFASQGSTFVYCGGTLINNEWIVSAAHCFSKSNNPSRITARLGEHNRRLNEGNEEVVTLKKIIIHPLYDRRSLNNDIAMIQLSRKVKYNKFIRPACVPSSGFEVASGTDAFVSGWGTTSEGGSTSPILQVASVPIMSKAECSSKMSGITDQKICAGYAKGGIDSCQGDSGGPLVAKNSKGKFDLIGVVSYGIGCARPNRPGVYAKVSALRAFIDSALLIGPPPGPVTTPPTSGSDPLTCNFEKDLCNWKQSSSDKFDWTRRSGSTPSSRTGPSASSTGKGYYLYIETSYPRRNGDSATLISPDISSGKPTCLRFKAHMYGSSINTLRIDKIEGSAKTALFTKVGNQGNKWLSFNVDLPAGGPYKVAITGIRGVSYRGDIAIDELRLTSSSCTPVTPPSTALLKCSFEKDLCNWNQSKSDKFDWKRRSGSTPSSGTGPSASSTGQKGHYLYIETSYPRRNGDSATLISPDISSGKPTCLRFKAHMYGSSINTLRIDKIEGSAKTALFTKVGNQGNKWLSFNVDLPAGGPYKVAITGIRGVSYRGDIAIDELRLTSSSCTPVTPPSTALLKCSFEKDLCNWNQSKSDKFDWKRRSGSTPSSGTGPSASSTGQKGHYLYIETSYPRRNGDSATLISPDISSGKPTCLRFKAHMYGSSINTLRIDKIEGSAKTALFTKVGNQGNRWLSFNVDLPAGGPYKVAITGIRGVSYKGDIAIDELDVTPNSCSGTGPTKPPAINCGKPVIAGTRVIAGIDAVRGSWPWQILMLDGSRPMCGGTLVTPTIVVTAAHCVSGRTAANFKIRVGEQDTRITEGSEVDLPVAKIVSHPSYTRSTIDYDIAVMKLAKPATLGTYVQTACLPGPNEEPPVGSDCYITGFGKIKHPGNMHHTLQQAKIRVVSRQTCTNTNTENLGITITERMICAGNGQGTSQSGCHGDSGGPFVCLKNGSWYLQGAVSWGSGSCSASAGYSVFAKVANPTINAWIRNQIAKL